MIRQDSEESAGVAIRREEEEEEEEELDGGRLVASALTTAPFGGRLKESAPAKRARLEGEGDETAVAAAEEDAEEEEEEEEEEMDGGNLADAVPARALALRPPPPPPPLPPPQPSPAPNSRLEGMRAPSFADELEAAAACASRMAAGEDLVRYGEPGWRERYYLHKLGIGAADDLKRRALCTEYVRGLQWVLRYYLQGVPSWTWYFGYHYAPLATDLVGLGTAWGYDALELSSFEVGEPFAPLEQLLAVLPPLSAHALPPCLASLMTDPASPLAEEYPRQLPLDLNGQSASWKAVVLLPFLDARRLHDVFVEHKGALAPDDAARNRFGPTYIYAAATDCLAPELWQLAAEHAHRDGHQMARVQQPVRSDPSLLAALTPYPAPPRGVRRDPPHPSLPRIGQNNVASAILRLPSPRIHVSVLLPGAAPPPSLHPDARPRSSPEEHWFAELLRGGGAFGTGGGAFPVGGGRGYGGGGGRFGGGRGGVP
jgi:5'-3' exoribonuclease 2